MKKQLPIDHVLPELLAALSSSNNAVLLAEPGAGKTTRVPLALLQASWLRGQRIMMLEPRRLAARAAAQYMARELGETVGERVGYRVRLDTKVGPRTVIEVVTEGVLTRMLQEDQALDGVGVILFDEFHERHLHGDLGLALALQSQQLLREDLRLVVMSATLEAEPIAALLQHAPVIRCEGRLFPVKTHYVEGDKKTPLASRMGRCIQSALNSHEGDVLAFLPGVREIRQTSRWLASAGLPANVQIRELYGSMPLQQQAEAVAVCMDGRRKVVLTTSIAESSITVDGVTVVIDSGLMRVSRFSPKSGMSGLETVSVSKASADQRRGRAGRLMPGTCYRLWREEEHRYLADQNAPEMLSADLSSLALELSIWGIANPAELDWVTPPPMAAYGQAADLLQRLGAMKTSGQPTAEGRLIARLGVHPRLGAMLLSAKSIDDLRSACELAALLSDRDILPHERNVDMELRLDKLRRDSNRDPALQRITAAAGHLERIVLEAERMKKERDGLRSIGVLLAAAYPDRIAQRRSDGRLLLAVGRGAVMPVEQPLSASPYVVACELDDAGAEGRVLLAAALSQEEIDAELTAYIRDSEHMYWDEQAAAVRASRKRMLGAIVLSEHPLNQPDRDRISEVLLHIVRQKGWGFLPMKGKAQSLLERMQLMARSGRTEWSRMTREALLASADEWLKPHLYGLKSRADLQQLRMADLLSGLLTWEHRKMLDEQAPTHLTAPSGSRIPIDYSNPDQPVVAVRLQELFGMTETPRLAGGTIPLTIHLLSPAQRPVQVTSDLKSFWSDAYFEVKKDLKGRYPKHYWPDNPLTAIATNRAKPRK
ncbi:ATP-dependent helicase HrpB [Paenibacillus sp. J5C_2022]|uniref:ATP-dependent helicase HrpB n=1 Tax=Paenibacillus sp. J5C2022 TaxID=2977129 RepID=UPI0021D1B7BF|nr:ATP-dependent helicase HrpB [Paenibacillus sp. J5C2022]MCU6707225.1 ATP-dependent helicase HrpB [Paenibacillus sp. J5C2022]